MRKKDHFNVTNITQISNDDIDIISHEFIHSDLIGIYHHYELSLVIIKNHELLCELSISKSNLYNKEFIYAYIWGRFIKDILLCDKDKIGKMIANYTGFIKIGEFTESYLANTLTYDLVYRDNRGIRELIESEMAHIWSHYIKRLNQISSTYMKDRYMLIMTLLLDFMTSLNQM